MPSTSDGHQLVAQIGGPLVEPFPAGAQPVAEPVAQVVTGCRPVVPQICGDGAPPGFLQGADTCPQRDASPAEALKTAREAAAGQDVRIGGGPTVVRDFLAAGLVDHMHLLQVPIVLGRGVRLWDGLEALEDAYDVEAVSSPSGVTHLTFTRTVVA